MVKLNNERVMLMLKRFVWQFCQLENIKIIAKLFWLAFCERCNNFGSFNSAVNVYFRVLYHYIRYYISFQVFFLIAAN